MPGRIVDAAAFARIQCNRCGECCERFHIVPEGDGEHWWNFTGPLGWLELYGYRVAHGGDPFSYMEMDGADPMLWFGQLEPHWNEYDDTWGYSCGYVSRDEPDGPATCTRHSTRPTICSRFPNGVPVRRDFYPDCSFAVQIVNFGLVKSAVDNLC